MISGVDNTIKIRRLFLDGFDGAPEHSLTSTAVVGVRMKKSYRILPVPSVIDHDGDDPYNQRQY